MGLFLVSKKLDLNAFLALKVEDPCPKENIDLELLSVISMQCCTVSLDSPAACKVLTLEKPHPFVNFNHFRLKMSDPGSKSTDLLPQ